MLTGVFPCVHRCGIHATVHLWSQLLQIMFSFLLLMSDLDTFEATLNISIHFSGTTEPGGKVHALMLVYFMIRLLIIIISAFSKERLCKTARIAAKNQQKLLQIEQQEADYPPVTCLLTPKYHHKWMQYWPLKCMRHHILINSFMLIFYQTARTTEMEKERHWLCFFFSFVFIALTT